MWRGEAWLWFGGGCSRRIRRRCVAWCNLRVMSLADYSDVFNVGWNLWCMLFAATKACIEILGVPLDVASWVADAVL